MNEVDFDPRANQLFEEAMAVKHENLQRALQLLDKAAQIDSRMLHICEGVQGGLLWQTERPRLALPHLQQAVKLCPLASFSSLLLFKVLLNLSRVNDAIAEAERFFTVFNASGHKTTQRITDYKEDFDYVLSLTDEELDEFLAEKMIKCESPLSDESQLSP